MASQQQQYNYGYSQQWVGGGGTAAAAAAAVSTQQQTWDGTRWVVSNVQSAPSTFSTTTSSYQTTWQQPQASSLSFSQQQSQQQQMVIPPNPVQTYTEYYHAYTDQVKLYQQQASTAGNEKVRADAECGRKWAQYQADQCSRAAHFFHQNPNATMAPFDLPPPPSTASTTTTAITATGTHHQSSCAPAQKSFSHSSNSYSHSASNNSTSLNHYQQQQQQQQVPTTQEESPQSLKVFVDRCMMQCRTDADRKNMMEKVEKLIQQALLQGAIQSKDWSQEVVPSLLLPAPVATTTSMDSTLTGGRGGATATTAASFHQANNSGYYGPTSSSSISPAPRKKAKKAKTHHSFPNHKKSSKNSPNSEANYYGPTSATQNDSKAEHDFISLSPESSKGHRKWERKLSGFNQTSSAMKHRAKRFSGAGGLEDATTSSSKTATEFDKYMGKSTIGNNRKKQLSEEDYERMTVKGKNQVLEKDYLRLTAPPRPELVRPQPILELHLKNLKAERARPDADRRDYLWFCSQLKAVRQDCTVQRIRNAFAVDVYETHAKIALEEADLNEYNQCQTQLKELYFLLKTDPAATANRVEFLAYRLLYYVFLSGNEKYNGGSSDLFHLMMSLTPQDRQAPAICHALQVRQAVADMDYHGFFRLRRSCPNLGGYLMDHIIPTMRFQGLHRMCKAYRPSVSIKFVLQELGFSTTEMEEEIEIGRQWLLSCACVLSDDGIYINTKESVVRESDMENRKSLI